VHETIEEACSTFCSLCYSMSLLLVACMGEDYSLLSFHVRSILCTLKYANSLDVLLMTTMSAN
jgi:hypothetical protein